MKRSPYIPNLRSKSSSPEMQWEPDDGLRHGATARMANERLEISRFGERTSHGQLFQITMALTVNNDIRGLLNSVNDGSTSAFMWEWFTTKPFVDAGEARFVSLQNFEEYWRLGKPYCRLVLCQRLGHPG